MHFLEVQPSVLMTNHDPEKAAADCPGELASKVLSHCLALLTSAWHRHHNSFCLPIDEDVPYEHLLEWVVPPVSTGDHVGTEVVAYHKDGPVRYGDKVFYLLLGQRVGTEYGWSLPQAEWIKQTGGNYRWVWRYAMALADPCPELWTLEAVPPALLDTMDMWSEVTPVVPAVFEVVEDGFFNTLESYKRYVEFIRESVSNGTQLI